MLKNKRDRILIVAVFVLCATGVTIQFYQDKLRHERLQNDGISTYISSIPSVHYGAESIDYYFVTTKGDTIRGSRKCPGQRGKYSGATIIYNPVNPYEYEFKMDFDRYDPGFRMLYYFCIYLPLMIVIVFGLSRMAISLYDKARTRQNKH